MIETRNFIGGAWVPSVSGQLGTRANPARVKSVVARFQLSTADDVKAAVNAAQEAFPAWRAKPAPERGRLVQKAAELMESRREELARTLTEEEGKILSEARGEIDRAVANMYFAAGQGARLYGRSIPSASADVLIFTQRVPLGVVGAITPWNFPIAIPAWKTCHALVCGNTVVFKPSSLTPLCGQLMTAVYEEAGIPPGVVNMVTGSGAQVGSAIAGDPRVKAISFTGSNAVGRGLYAEAARRLCRVQLELGGKNPVIVLEDADIDRAADAIVEGAFGSTGQRCTCTSRAVVQTSAAKSLTEALVERAKKIVTGYGLNPDVTMGPLVDEQQKKTVTAYIQKGKAEGARVLFEQSDDGLDEGHFVQPVIFDRVQPGMTIHQEEIFGPVLSTIEVKDFDEAIRVANSVDYGLSSSIYTRDLQQVLDYIKKSEAGMLHVNIPTLGGEGHVPFGGMKESSLGEKECGPAAMDFFTEEQIIYARA